MDTLKQLAQEIADDATKIILQNLRHQLPKMVKDAKNFVWTEEEAAAKLKMSSQTLGALRKSGVIDFCYLIPPTRWTTDGKPLNGRPGYMDHHILDFLARNEVRNGNQKVTMAEVWGFLSDTKK